MSKQQILPFFILVLVTLAASYFIMGASDYSSLLDKLEKNTSQVVIDANKPEEKKTQQEVETVTLDETTKTYAITGSYRSDIPQEVQQHIQAVVSEFKGYEYVPTAGGVYDLSVSVEMFNGGEYSSYAVTHSEYTGGANVNSYIRAFAYDGDTKLVSKDMFNQERVQGLIREDLKNQFGNDIWFNQDLNKDSLLDNFYFNEDDVVFVFSQYEVAPGAAGLVTVTIPTAKLSTSQNKKDFPAQLVKPEPVVTDFFSCIDVTGTILESYPRQCVFGGKTFVEKIKEAVTLPGDTITLSVSVGPERVSCTGLVEQKCLVVDGEYFYDPIKGFDNESGYRYELDIARTLQWGTTDPSQIPADAGLYEYELVRVVSKVQEIVKENTCVVAGCSSQLCISADEQNAGGGISTCEYREEYACYAMSECRVQESGACGWTLTQEVQACLANPPSLQ